MYPASPEIETFSEDATAGDEARLPAPQQRSTTRGPQPSMAHVLLPCNLPSWPEVQRYLQGVRSCRGVDDVVKIMLQIHETSSVSLDPEDSAPIQGHPGFECIEKFLVKENQPVRILADIADWASKLSTLKPGYGLHYSLRTEDGTFCLERSFVVSLMANSFFSTFPRRKVKTHPTLLDFNMAEFFTRLDDENHQSKLRAFFRYFEGLEPEPDGSIQFSRKVFRGPSLPGWLCSERPLVPLVIRPQGTIDEAEPWVFRGCSCSSLVGGNVLCESTSKESCLFFEFPELIVSLCFLESLVDDEAIIVEGVRAPNTQEVNFCFMDVSYIDQLDDCNLLKSLNKAVAAFQHEPRFVDRRRTPDGGESSERSCESREGRISTAAERLRRIDCPKMLSAKNKKSLSQASSKFSMRTASETSVKLDDEYYTADEESEPESSASRPDRPPSSLHSFGFVLAHSEDEDDDLSSRHERLEDFRRRIRKRTRRRKLSRRSSSYSSGGSSSDMEDISEDPEDNVKPILTVRPACSEPSLVTLADADTEYPKWLSPDALLSPSGHKQLAATCSGGHLKSYSHDGVRPNLPVPFRAKFRVKKKASDDWDHSKSTDEKGCLPSRCPVAVAAGEINEDPQLRALVLWLAASMAQLPALILYTMNEPALREIIQIYNQVRNRQWTIGDLACEVLRFCRNRIAPGHRTGKHSHLFGQLLAEKNSEERQTSVKKIFKEESLD